MTATVNLATVDSGNTDTPLVPQNPVLTFDLKNSNCFMLRMKVLDYDAAHGVICSRDGVLYSAEDLFVAFQPNHRPEDVNGKVYNAQAVVLPDQSFQIRDQMGDAVSVLFQVHGVMGAHALYRQYDIGENQTTEGSRLTLLNETNEVEGKIGTMALYQLTLLGETDQADCQIPLPSGLLYLITLDRATNKAYVCTDFVPKLWEAARSDDPEERDAALLTMADAMSGNARECLVDHLIKLFDEDKLSANVLVDVQGKLHPRADAKLIERLSEMTTPLA